MEQRQGLKEEIDSVLASPLLQRSPTQAKLLAYLAKHGDLNIYRPTQYELATEALGRSDDFDETTDSTVRVHMSRLRKSLREYYTMNQPRNGLCAFIPPGEYRIRVARFELAYPEFASPRHEPRCSVGEGLTDEEHLAEQKGGRFPFILRVRSPKWRNFGAAAILLVLAFSLSAVFPFSETVKSNSQSAALSRPSIALEIDVAGDLSIGANFSECIEVVRTDWEIALQKSLVSELADAEEKADFRLNLKFLKRAYSTEAFVSLRSRDGTLVAQGTHTMPEDMQAARTLLNDELIRIIMPPGELSRWLVNLIPSEPRNGFECFVAVETGRSAGHAGAGLLDYCVQSFPEHEYNSYLQARHIFGRIQGKLLSGEKINESDDEWQQLSDLIRDEPNNAYTNALAAKLLIAQDRCEDARRFAVEAFSRGRTYPTLELAVIVDAWGCSDMENLHDFWSTRIRDIARANPDPNPLLRAYIILGAIASEQHELPLRSASFGEHSGPALARLSSSLEAIYFSPAREDDFRYLERTMPSLIFSVNTQSLIRSKMRAQ